MKKQYFSLLLGILMFLSTFTAGAAASSTSSPWGDWRKAFQAYDKAEEHKDAGEFAQALIYYTQGRDYFSAIRKNFPDWNSKVVSERVKLCEKRMAEMKSRTGKSSGTSTAARPKKKKTRSRKNPPKYSTAEERPIPESDNDDSSAAAAPAAQGRLMLEMQSEIDQYRQRLRKALVEIDNLQVKLRQSEARARDVEGVLRENRLLQEKYSLLEMQYKDLQSRNNGVDRERHEAQLLSLQQANDEALKQIKILEETIRQKDQEYAQSRTDVLKQRNEVLTLTNENRRLQRELELQNSRSGSSSAINELNSKIRNLQQALNEKEQQIERLMNLLGESANDGSTLNTALQNEVKRMQKELDQLRQNSSSESDLRRRISELTAAESQLQKLLAEAAERLKERDSELQTVKKSNIEQQQQIQKLSSENKALQEKIQTLDRELKNAVQRYAALDKRYQDRLRSDAVAQEKNASEKRSAMQKISSAEKQARADKDEIAKLRQINAGNQKLLQESRASLIELTAKVQSNEVELAKMKNLQKAYDELKAKFDLAAKTGSNDIVGALNRIPGLEEAIRRYEKENKLLLAQLAELKKSVKAAAPASAVPATSAVKVPEVKVPEVTPKQVLQPERIGDFLAEARSSAARGNLELAKWNCQQVLLRDELNIEARMLLGKLHLREENFAEALKYLKNLITPSGNNEEDVHALVRSYIGVRNYPEALKLLREFRAKRKGRASARMLLAEAVAWSRSGNNAKAEQAFKVVLQLDRNNAEAPYELALMLSADPKRLQEAGEFYRLAQANGVEKDSYLEEVLGGKNNANVSRDFLLNNMREALERDDMISAAWYLKEADKQVKHDPEVEIMRMVMFLLENKPAEVVKQLAKATDHRQKFLLALAYLQCSQADKAAELLKYMPRLHKTAVPGKVLAKFIQKNASGKDAKSSQLYNELLKNLP